MNIRSINKKEQLIQATLELIAQQGLENTSMKQVISRANVATGTCYHYFKSKEALLSQTLDFIYNQLHQIVQSQNVYSPYLESYNQLFEATYSYLVTHPDVFRAMQVLKSHLELTDSKALVTSDYHQDLQAYFNAGITAKAFVYLPAKLLTAQFLADVHTLVKYQLEEELLPDATALTKAKMLSWQSKQFS